MPGKLTTNYKEEKEIYLKYLLQLFYQLMANGKLEIPTPKTIYQSTSNKDTCNNI
jgi:hypothetical protein